MKQKEILIFMRKNEKCLFDPVLKKLVQYSENEIIKQQLILFLLDELKVPANMIFYNEKISQYCEGLKGTFEVTINLENDNILYPLCSISLCLDKSKAISQTWTNLEQKSDLAEFPFLMLFDGKNGIMKMWEHDLSEYQVISKPLLFQEMCKIVDLEHSYFETPFNFLKSESQTKSYDLLKEEYIIGEDTDPNKFEFVRLISKLIYEQGSDEKYKHTKFTGVRSDFSGNAGGGIWSGLYRYLLFCDNHLMNTEVYTLSIMASAKTLDDPHWGTRRGETLLIVGVDDYLSHHNSLQLNIHKFVKIRGESYIVWHDGTLTNGKKGSCKKAEVISFIEKRAPELLDDNKNVFLGNISINADVTQRNIECHEFVSRLIKYAKVRDDYRKHINKDCNNCE